MPRFLELSKKKVGKQFRLRLSLTIGKSWISVFGAKSCNPDKFVGVFRILHSLHSGTEMFQRDLFSLRSSFQTIKWRKTSCVANEKKQFLLTLHSLISTLFIGSRILPNIKV